MTRKLVPLILGALAATAVPAQATDRRAPEEQLARALEGRVAGEPVDCVNLRTIQSSRVIRGTAILYDAGSVIYVNRPRAGAELLDHWGAQVSRTFDNRLCSVDPVQIVDTATGMFEGNIFLGEFVPYRRVRSRD